MRRAPFNRPTVWLSCLVGLASSTQAQFATFNDYDPGLGTGSNVTIYGTAGAAASGLLKNITNGQSVGITLTVTSANVSVATDQGEPGYGTPAFIGFDGYVDFSGTNNPSIQLAGSSAVWTYTFTGLNPNAEYNFQGTAVRGEATYTNRWTLFTIGGAASFTSRHTSGALTTAQVPSLLTNQVAINTGDNTAGDLAWWEHIRPGASGSFSVTSIQYLGPVPGGSSAGTKSYGMTGLRLEQGGTYSGRTSVPPRLPNLAPNSINGVESVFVIMMENHSWGGTDGITDPTKCPYLNYTLLPMAATAAEYYTPPRLHPSEPNYLWLISGTNFGIRNDSAPSVNQVSSTNNLFTQLDRAGISWKGYFEGISGTNVPDNNDTNTNYAVRHNPFVFFESVRTNLAYCTNHERPYIEFAPDLTNNRVARFNFLVPNLTNDMHNLTSGSPSARTQGDTWLSHEVPKILGSTAYLSGGALFIVWDEGSANADGPLGMIVVSPRAIRAGYTNTIRYTHSSLLRTWQDIFGVRPYLGDAAYANNLNDLFKTIQLTSVQWQIPGFTLSFTNVIPGKTNYLQVSTNLAAANWFTIQTNLAASTSFTFTDPESANSSPRYYRVVELP